MKKKAGIRKEAESQNVAELRCERCEELGRSIAEKTIEKCRATMVKAYEEAGLSGLCQEGRFELALDSLRAINLNEIIASALLTPPR